jgi:ribosome-associated protein
VIEINAQLSIPEEELHFAASRSGGPGGQNVNKVSSKITLTFDVLNSPSLDEDQRARISSRLSTRINKDGVLRVVSQTTRSQDLNREEAIARFIELLRDALFEHKPRKKKRVPASAKAKRLEEKKKRTRIKQDRKRGFELD